MSFFISKKMNTLNTQNQLGKTVLFISELPDNILDTELEDFFSDYKDNILMIQIERNKNYDFFNTRKPKATIIFKDYDKANEARNQLNMKRLKGKALNIMWHEKDNSIRYNNTANIFVNGIPLMLNLEKFLNYLINMVKLFLLKFVKMKMEIY